MIKPEQFKSSEGTQKGRVTRALQALVAGGILAAATPSEALGQESYRDGARVTHEVDATRTVNVSREAGMNGEITYRYVNEDAVFFDEGQIARMPIVPREEGIQNEDLYLSTLGLNPVVPRHLNLTPAERRAYALRSPEANADALIADGFPRELRSRLVQDFRNAQSLTQSQIEENQVYLVPGFVSDGMTQSDGNGGVRPVGLDAQEIRMRLERAQQGGARFVSYPGEVISTYIWTDARNVSHEIIVFVIDECGNSAFKMRQIEQVEQPSVRNIVQPPEIVAPQETLPPCRFRRVALQNIPSGRENNTVVNASFTYDRSTARVISAEEYEAAEAQGCPTLVVSCSTCVNDATRWSIRNVTSNTRRRSGDLRAVDFQTPVVNAERSNSTVLIVPPQYVLEVAANGERTYLAVNDVWTATCFQTTVDGDRYYSSALTTEPNTTDFPEGGENPLTYVQPFEFDNDIRSPMWTLSVRRPDRSVAPLFSGTSH